MTTMPADTTPIDYADVQGTILRGYRVDFARHFILSITDPLAAGTLLTDLVMPAAVKEIGDRAFAETPSLKSITFSEGLLRIGEASFSGSGLTSVTLPRSLSLIGSGAFSNSPIQTATVDKNTSVLAKTEVFSAGAIVKTYEGLDWTTLAP